MGGAVHGVEACGLWQDSLTVILCFQPDKNSICSVNNLFKADKLVNTADHCFNIKMEFDAADGRGVWGSGAQIW